MQIDGGAISPLRWTMLHQPRQRLGCNPVGQVYGGIVVPLEHLRSTWEAS